MDYPEKQVIVFKRNLRDILKNIKQEDIKKKENLFYLIPFILIIPIYLYTNKNRPDYLMLFATFLFVPSLIPTIINPNAVMPRKSSLTIGLGIGIIMLASLDLGLHLTVIGNFVTFILWIHVFIYRGPSSE